MATNSNISSIRDTGYKLPDLHEQAFFIKNRRRLKHDGGQAWIKDGQLYEAVSNANYRIESGVPLTERLKDTGRAVLERRTGALIRNTNSHRKL